SAPFRVEGLGSYPRGPMLAAHVDLDLGAGLGEGALDVGHPGADLERGREGAAGHRADDDAARAEHRVAVAGDPGALDREGGQALGGALGARLRDRGRAEEPRRLLAAPAEVGLDRVALGAQLVAVQRVTDLEAQGVAGAEPAGDDAGFTQLFEDRDRDLRV